MKRLLLVASALFLFLAPTRAQIILSDTSYSATAITGNGAGTIDSGSIAYGANGAPVVTGGPSNALWDLSGANYSVNDTLFMRHNPWTNYTYSDFVLHTIGLYYIDTRPLYTMDATGWVENGEQIDGRGYGLGTLTGNANDSIVFDQQLNLYTFNHTILKFPTHYGDHWNSNYMSNINFRLTISAAFIFDSAGTIKTFFNETDSVVGWGKMRVKNLGDTASGDMDVLQVKVKVHQVDSFFLGDQPAAPFLLSSFQLTQGHDTDIYMYKFYRSHEVTPLAEIAFNDNTYSNGSINNTRVHEQRLAVKHVGVTNVIKAADISIYPNPVTGRTVNIAVPQSGNWSYELVNSLGQIVTTNTLNLKGQTKTQVTLPSVASGVYYLHLINDGNSILFKALTIK